MAARGRSVFDRVGMSGRQRFRLPPPACADYSCAAGHAQASRRSRPLSKPPAARRPGGAAARAVPTDASPGLPDEPEQARRFGKARTARAAALHEDYVELIDDLLAAGGEARTTDIARRLGVSHPTANKCIARLKRAGLATARPYRGVFLTASGQALAARVRARHRLVVDLLRAVGVTADDAESDAEGIEHHVSDATLAAFGRFLRHHAASGSPPAEVVKSSLSRPPESAINAGSRASGAGESGLAQKSRAAAEGATGPRKRSGKRTVPGSGISGKPGGTTKLPAPTE
jgi:DtxR family manganese transport transcriptional regulator